jgi:maltose O-acetyltransferase
MFGSGVLICDRDGDRIAPIRIEDDVWLAHGAAVYPGVRIGRGSVVSAGSVVRSDIPPDTLAVGNPARALPMHLVAAS